jgi:hypothetical protein
MSREIQELRDLLEKTLITTRDSASPSLSKVIIEFQGEFKLFKQEVFTELRRIGDASTENRARICELEKWRTHHALELAQKKGGLQYTHKFILFVVAIFGGIAGIISWSFDIFTHLKK